MDVNRGVVVAVTGEILGAENPVADNSDPEDDNSDQEDTEEMEKGYKTVDGLWEASIASYRGKAPNTH